MGDMKKMRKGLWSPDEDEKLSRCIAMYMNGSWSDIARKAGLQRCGKSCRRRWMNHLRPDLKRGRFTPAEISRVVELHNALGNRWSEIAGHLVGRTDNDVKNLWNTQIKRHLKQLSHPASLTATAISAVSDDLQLQKLADLGALQAAVDQDSSGAEKSSDSHLLHVASLTQVNNATDAGAAAASAGPPAAAAPTLLIINPFSAAGCSVECQQELEEAGDHDITPLQLQAQILTYSPLQAVAAKSSRTHPYNKSVFAFPFSCTESDPADQHQAESTFEELEPGSHNYAAHNACNSVDTNHAAPPGPNLKTEYIGPASSAIMMQNYTIPHALSSSNLSELASRITADHRHGDSAAINSYYSGADQQPLTNLKNPLCAVSAGRSSASPSLVSTAGLYKKGCCKVNLSAISAASTTSMVKSRFHGKIKGVPPATLQLPGQAHNMSCLRDMWHLPDLQAADDSSAAAVQHNNVSYQYVGTDSEAGTASADSAITSCGTASSTEEEYYGSSCMNWWTGLDLQVPDFPLPDADHADDQCWQPLDMFDEAGDLVYE